MSMITFGHAYAVMVQSDLEAKRREEERKRKREEIRSASRLRKQTSFFRQDPKARERYMRKYVIPLDDAVAALSVLSGDESNYKPTKPSDKTRIEVTLGILEGQLEQLLNVLPRGKYLELRNALLYLQREASTICKTIRCPDNTDDPNKLYGYEWSSRRIGNFVHSYKQKIQGYYLRPDSQTR